MCVRLRGSVIAAVLLAPSASLAQVQVNQTFVPMGPSPSIGAVDVVQSGDAGSNGTVTGAVQAILLDPALGPNTMFLASPNGGIWRTSNGGASWAPLTDKQASLSIASLGLDPTDTSGNTLVAGVGLTSNGVWDSFNRANRSGSGGQQTGLLYSTNGGSTWTPMGASPLSGQSVIGVAALGNTILAATFEEQGATVTSNGAASYGLYRSVDRGTSFSLVSGAPGAGLPAGPVTALVADPHNSANCGTQGSCILYASVTSPSSPLATGVYKSVNSGQTWSPVFTSATAVSGGSNYIAVATDQLVPKLATGPNGSVAIAIANAPASGAQQLHALYLSQNGGATWSALAVPVLSYAPVNQAVVNLAVAIDRSNTSIVYVAGDGLNNSPFTVTAFRVQGNLATSLTDSHTSNNSTAHSDARTLVLDSAGNLLMGSDGGIYVRSNPQNDNGAWTGLNTSTLQIREPSAVAYGANAKRLIFAAQDTGIAIQSAPNSVLFNAIQGADGVNAVVSDKTFAHQSVYYNSFFNYGELSRLILDSHGNRVSPGAAPNGVPITCNHGFDCASQVTGQEFSSPFVLNKVDPTRVALAGGHVYLSTDTAPASAPSVDLILNDLGPTHGRVLALAYGTTDNPNVVLAGNNNANGLYLSTTGAAGSIAPIAGFAGQVPTSLVFDQRSQNRFYVADSFSLWGTRNQGATFQNLTTNLPTNIIRPTGVEFINNNGVDALLIGGLSGTANAPSQITVADSDANGNLSGWRPFGSGLPNALVSQMSYNPLGDVLAIGAVGRGVWALYDVTSYFSQATTLQFGLADNDSVPDASFLTNGTSANRPLIKYGIGTLTIAGKATYAGGTTIKNGALVLGAGGPSGSIIGDVTFCSNAADSSCNASSNKLLAFNRSDAYTFAGTISGPGSVLQDGVGVTILTAHSNYTGPTNVNAGALIVDGSILSPVFVNSGGALGGTGGVGTTTVLSGGVLAPGGNGIGTLRVNGDLTLSPGSFYQANVSKKTADRTVVTGAATLAGTADFLFRLGVVAHNYSILSASGGLTGTFDSLVSMNLRKAFVSSLKYSSTDVTLSVKANLSGLASVTSASPSSKVVAAVLDGAFNSSVDDSGPAGALIASLTAPDSTVLHVLSGEGATATQETAFGSANSFVSMMKDQTAFWLSGDAIDPDGVTFGSAALPYTRPERKEHPAFSKLNPSETAYANRGRMRAWSTGFDGTWKLNGASSSGSASATHKTAGGAAGLDYQLDPDLLVGFAVGGSTSNFSVADLATGGEIAGTHLGVYGVKRLRSFYVDAALSFSTFGNTTSRSITGVDTPEVARGQFNSNLLSARLELGWKQSFKRFSVTPFAAIQLAELWQSGYTETTGIVPGVAGFGLSYAPVNVPSLPTFLGVEAATRTALPNGMIVSPYGRISWVHEFYPTREVTAFLTALPSASFIVDGPSVTRDAVKLDIGSRVALNRNAMLFGNFVGQFSDRSQMYSGKGGFRLAW